MHAHQLNYERNLAITPCVTTDSSRVHRQNSWHSPLSYNSLYLPCTCNTWVTVTQHPYVEAFSQSVNCTRCIRSSGTHSSAPCHVTSRHPSIKRLRLHCATGEIKGGVAEVLEAGEKRRIKAKNTHELQEQSSRTTTWTSWYNVKQLIFFSFFFRTQEGTHQHQHQKQNNKHERQHRTFIFSNIHI